MVVMMLGSNVGSPPYQETFRGMQHTLHRQKTPAAGLMAADRHPTRLP